MDRKQTLAQVRVHPEVSVLIIGAGINGIGTFRDLALQGVDVLMVDRGDYCSGASAASSHMVHGGIRYLENGEFRLVREAVRERNRLIENAPHLVKPLPTVFPIFKWFSGIFNAPFKFLGLLDRPAERGAVVIKIGMTLYDAYTRAQATVPNHIFMSRKASLAKFPRLNPEVLFTGTYYDGAMPCPERICIELVEDARRDHPQALALNYVSVTGTAGKVVTLRDEETGESFQVKPKLVINAAGPWIDFTNQALGIRTQLIGGTKGSHLILDHPELWEAIRFHEFFFENKDGRIVLIFPLMGKVMIGTSDIRVENPDEARCTDEEIEYFFDLVGRVFPDIKLDRSQIVFQFSGVRPLPFTPEGYTGQISRDHSIVVREPDDTVAFPVYSLVGGKWTTFRALAEQVTDNVLPFLGITRRKDTRSLPIGGGADYPGLDEPYQIWLIKQEKRTGLSLERLKELFGRYGTRAARIAAYIAEGKDTKLVHLPGYSHREIAFLALHEDVIHLDDIVLRRSLMAYLGQISAPLLEELASAAGEVLGWSAQKKLAEIERTKAILADRHGVVL